jgi:hypothetical protein
MTTDIETIDEPEELRLFDIGALTPPRGSLGEGVDLRYAARIKTGVYLAVNALGQKMIVKPKAGRHVPSIPIPCPGPAARSAGPRRARSDLARSISLCRRAARGPSRARPCGR